MKVMMMEYVIDDEAKKQLGFIIKEYRKIKFKLFKTKYLIESNPYTKENFCENNNICHYHTLTKLENDMIKEDHIYQILLKKLGLYYKVSRSEHKNNMEFIHSLSKDLLKSIEYIDDTIANDIKKRLVEVKFEKDCIADMYNKLIEVIVDLQLLIKVKEDRIDLIEKFTYFYEGIYKGIALQTLGIYHLNKENLEEANNYFSEAKSVYTEYNISEGVINSFLITVNVLLNNYLKGIQLCNQMEEYYIMTKNYKRLMHVYNYLSDYYLLINANEMAERYFQKAIEIIDNNKGLERFKYYLYYNWGWRCFKDYRFEEAINYFNHSYEYSTNNVIKLQTIIWILIILTKLKATDEEIYKYYEEGERYFSYGTDFYKIIFKYFRYKLNNNKYYRRYALEKIIPLLKNSSSRNEILIFFYEDLYK